MNGANSFMDALEYVRRRKSEKSLLINTSKKLNYFNEINEKERKYSEEKESPKKEEEDLLDNIELNICNKDLHIFSFRNQNDEV